MNKTRRIYRVLHKTFGPQGWWPITVKTKNKENEVFEIIIGAILTQNTNWKNVEKALVNLNKERLIDIKKIKNIKKEKLAKLIKPSGYYNQKAERVKLIADFFDKNIDCFLKEKNIKKLRNKLLKIKGIGEETADSILLYAFEKPIFVIDAYTKRIMAGVGFKFKDYDELQNIFMSNIDSKLFKEYHALLVELGKNYCKNKNPNCRECPIKLFCKRKGLNKK